MWFKKWISDIKFHQNNEQLSFPMVLIDFHMNYDPETIQKRSKNDLKYVIKNDQIWSNMIMW